MVDYISRKFIPDMDINEYHALTDYVSSTHLKLLAKKTPAHLKFMLDGKKKFKSTKSIKIGTNSHDLLSSPIEFMKSIVEVPEDLNRNHNDYKKLKADNPGKNLFKPSESKVLIDMNTQLLSEPAVVALLSSSTGKAEVSCFFQDPETGLKCKIRPDFLPGMFIVTDYKTTKNAAEEAFRSDCFKLGYDIQAAFYTWGMEILTGEKHAFWFVAQETEEPYLPAIYPADQEMVDCGMEKVRKHLNTIADCKESGRWPGYITGQFKTISPKSWERLAA